jgi:hypothetical protein
MPDPNLVPKLIERLIDLSEEGKIDWKETASEDDFQATVAQYVVTISRTRNKDDWDAWDYQIRVADRKGTLIDEATDTDFDRELRIGPHPPYKAFMLLYDSARRSARNVDQALTELLETLDSMEK